MFRSRYPEYERNYSPISKRRGYYDNFRIRRSAERASGSYARCSGKAKESIDFKEQDYAYCRGGGVFFRHSRRRIGAAAFRKAAG